MSYFKITAVFTLVLLLDLADSATLAASEAEECENDGKQFKVGEQYDVPGHCSGNVCKGNNEWALIACGLLGGPQKWIYVPENTSKPYPECCGTMVPPLDIVPDVLDKAPGYGLLDIEYAGGNKADLGNELTPTQVKTVPSVNYSADSEAFYTLYMTDPDAPSRAEPTSREFRHWLVVNIPGNNVQDGEEISEYIGAGPPKSTGLHRYVFLLYKQPGKLTFEEPKELKTSLLTRGKTFVRRFAEKYHLGHPLAVNLFQAQYDDYVPQLYKEIGFN